MNEDQATIYADLMAQVLDLQLSPESRDVVTANLRILFARAGDFLPYILPDDLDPAPLLRL